MIVRLIFVIHFVSQMLHRLIYYICLYIFIYVYILYYYVIICVHINMCLIFGRNCPCSQPSLLCFQRMLLSVTDMLSKFQPHRETINSLDVFGQVGRTLVLSASSDCSVVLSDISGNRIGSFGQVGCSSERYCALLYIPYSSESCSAWLGERVLDNQQTVVCPWLSSADHSLQLVVDGLNGESLPEYGALLCRNLYSEIRSRYEMSILERCLDRRHCMNWAQEQNAKKS